MLKTVVLSAFFAVAVVCAPALAQTNPPAPDQAAPPPGAAPAAPAAEPSPGAMGAKPSAKELVASCRADARSKGLKGDEFKSAVNDCVGAQRPKVAARMQCHQQGKAQGKDGDDLKAFVKDCMAQGKQ
jgi:hypothetical protein